MRDEFLLNCEKEILEANLFLMCGQHEEGIQATRKVLDAIMKEIVNGIQPITKKYTTICDCCIASFGKWIRKTTRWQMENYNKCRDSDRKQDRV